MTDFLQDLYPTPAKLISRLFEGLSFSELSSVLEPSAGKGDICDALQSRMDSYHRCSNVIDTIEINPELQHILRGKGFNVVHDDFLTFKTVRPYDLIIANFPFSRGDEHLLRALHMLETNGGKLVCLVNAQTILKTFTNSRQTVCGKLEALGASIEYLTGEFTDAERKTNVEVALIRVEAKRPEAIPILLDDLKRAEEAEARTQNHEQIIEKDYISAMVSRFDLECKLGAKLINEYYALKPYILDRHLQKGEEDKYRSPLIELQIKGGGTYGNINSQINEYLPLVREKYWEILVNDPRFVDQYTSNIQSDLNDKLRELRSCDFNKFNIEQLMKELAMRLSKGVEKAILDLFDRFSRGHAYGGEFDEGNIHYYTGWKTNKAHRVNKKVIIPLHGYSAGSKTFDYRAYEQLRDMVKIFNYLAADRREKFLLEGMRNNITPGYVVDFRYFEIKTYKKGTCHIKFLDQDLLDKFNIFGSQRKGWLPPTYGKKPYDEMEKEEKEVVDTFQGKEKYEQVMENSDFFIVEDALGLLGA